MRTIQAFRPRPAEKRNLWRVLLLLKKVAPERNVVVGVLSVLLAADGHTRSHFDAREFSMRAVAETSVLPEAPASTTPITFNKIRSIQLPDDSENDERKKRAESPIPLVAEVSDPWENLLRQIDVLPLVWLGAERQIAAFSPKDLSEQGAMFSRIVMFLEMRGAPRMTIVSQKAMGQFLAAKQMRKELVTVGNNLRGSDLARFFNFAALQGEALSDSERKLLEFLLQHDVIKSDGPAYRSTIPEKILVTIPRVSEVADCAACAITPALRIAIAQHELAHARYFVDDAYRDFASWFWANAIDSPMKKRFTDFLIARGYDDTNTSLMANEMQAFLMHTLNPSLFAAVALGVSQTKLNELRDLFSFGMKGLGLREGLDDFLK